MKKTILTLLGAFAPLFVSAQTLENYRQGDPGNPGHAYLKEYAPLRNYIDRGRFPDFRLGVGTTVSQYLSDATFAGLVNDNFTETVAGNAMKMSSCVSNGGSMDFSKVTEYVDAAEKAGLQVYGHTLAWHSQQPVGWLRGLIKDKPAVPFENPDTIVNVELGSKDFRREQSVGWTSDRTQYGFSLDFSSADGLKIQTTKVVNFWEVQFIAYDNLPVEAGRKYGLVFEIKGSREGVLHAKLGDWNAGVYVDVPFSTEWNTVTVSFESPVGCPFLLLQCGDYVGDIYIRSVKVEESVGAMKDGGALVLPASVPLSGAEKREILGDAMERWIKGMMEACGGRVKAWDVVNEAVAGSGDDGGGNYTLQHSEGFNGDAAWDVGGDSFYWQDHMGDLEYVRTAVRLARKYGPADIRLFINDYNLESDWDGNKKLKSLINWLEKWEADGVTRIDGIGTQMHISYYETSGTLTAKKLAISKMFRLMAATGKLVRVSELDMGYVDAAGKEVPTSQMTDRQHKNMADFYEWILKEYFRLVPPEQQWGVCFWCPADAPAGSSWRAGSPVGLWTEGTFYRKHAYAGVVRGLGGIDYTGIEEVPGSKDGMSAPGADRIYSLDGLAYPEHTELSDLPSGLYIRNSRLVAK